jgi:DNA mismatch endonuclease (patch repair protein)
MPEKFTNAERSRIMAAVKSRDTMPEMVVRRMVYGLGYRFRLHVRGLPGTPDIVLPRHGKIINVHGCFWHLHSCPHGRRAPVNHSRYWRTKREGNAVRDCRNLEALKSFGWKVLTIWECETKDRQLLARRVARFLAM